MKCMSEKNKNQKSDHSVFLEACSEKWYKRYHVRNQI